jgi:hypothetical protein
VLLRRLRRPLASAATWTLASCSCPVLAATWVLRVGVDVGDDGVTVRSPAAARHVPWGEVAGIRVAERGDLRLVTTRGTELRLPALRARDLPRLAAVSGGRIPPLAPPEEGPLFPLRSQARRGTLKRGRRPRPAHVLFEG